MWEANSANDCMRLHKIRKSHLILATLHHNTALLSTLHVAFLHITMHMFILLKYRDFSPPNDR